MASLSLAAPPPDVLAPRSRLLLTYAMCGFANVGSLGALIPERRAKLGLRSVLSGILATLTSGALVGLLS